MKRIIKLTESQLDVVIKKVISEQSSMFDTIKNPSGKPKFDITKKNPINPLQQKKTTPSQGFDKFAKPKFDITKKPTGINPDVRKDTTKFSPTFTKETPTVKKQSIYKQTNPLSSTIKYGDRGPQVKSIQNNLISLGYQVSADGDFGPLTKGKVVAFQQANNLKPTGIVDNETGALLSRQVSTKKTTDAVTKNPLSKTDGTKIPLKNPTQKEVPMPKTKPIYHTPNDFGPAQTSKVPPLLNPNTKPDQKFNYGLSETYIGGMVKKALTEQSSHIINLQKKLIEKGYKINADGIVGQDTKNAILDFQGKNKLTKTGSFDNPTITAIIGHKPQQSTILKSSPQMKSN